MVKAREGAWRLGGGGGRWEISVLVSATMISE